MKFLPDFSDIERAHEIIQKYVHRTPVYTCSGIDKITGGKLRFLSRTQKMGSLPIPRETMRRRLHLLQTCGALRHIL